MAFAKPPQRRRKRPAGSPLNYYWCAWRRWSRQAEEITGDGQFAVVRSCGGTCIVTLYDTAKEALDHLSSPCLWASWCNPCNHQLYDVLVGPPISGEDGPTADNGDTVEESEVICE